MAIEGRVACLECKRHESADLSFTTMTTIDDDDRLTTTTTNGDDVRHTTYDDDDDDEKSQFACRWQSRDGSHA